MNEQLDLENLRRWVRQRRDELDLSHLEIQQLGGPSTTTMTKIEAGRGPAPRRDVVKRLEHVLGWPQGSVRRILAGGEPGPTSMSREPGRLAELLNDYIDRHPKATDDVIAGIVGVPQSTVREWRTQGLAEMPPAADLRKLAALLGVDESVTFHAVGVDLGYVPSTERDQRAGA